jgi:hypothetical protein
MIEMRSLADEFPDDVERMKTCLHAAGRTWTDDDVVLAWSDYSDNWCAGWLKLPDSDDDLLTILLKHWPLRHGVTDCYVAKLIPAKDSSGDVWLLVPDDAMHAAGWRIGDELEVERQGDTLVLRRLTNKAKK